MSALKVVQAEVVGSVEFEQLDKQITEVIRDFVQLGELLIKMRDGQHYRTAGYQRFEDYCKAKAGLSISEAQRTIRYHLGYKAIIENGGRDIAAPVTKAQVEALLPVASFNTEVREYVQQHPTQGEKRQKVEQVVGIKNPAKVAAQWEKTVKEFERLTAKAEKEGTRPPTLSGKFVRNLLPNDLKVSPERSFPSKVNPLVHLANRLAKLHDDITQQGLTDARKVPTLITAEPPLLSPQVGDLKEQAEAIVTDLQKLLAIMADYE